MSNNAGAYFLEPGYIYSSQAGTIQAVLGVCVSVCLWDCNLKYGGMNHFVMPFTTDSSNATPRYGNVATLALIKMMCEAGCCIEELRAHVIGGGHPEGKADSVGSKNVEVARNVLKQKGVTIVSEDVGGAVGRKVVFDICTGHVAVLKVHKIRKEDWLYGCDDV